jgi:hypothetical protein
VTADGLDPTLEEDGSRIVSYSELDTFRQCPLKHHFAYDQRWTKPPAEDSALTKGSLWHAVMETHYKTLIKSKFNGKPRTAAQVQRALDACRAAVTPLFRNEETGEQSDNQALVEWMYNGYVEFHGVNESWRIIGVEHQIIAPLRDEDGNRSLYRLKAKIDLLIEDLILGTRWVVDHKSCANLPYQFEMDMDDQFGLYVWSMRQVGRPVQGSLHSAARTTRNQADKPGYEGKAKPQELSGRFKLTLLTRTPVELENLALDAFRAAQAAYPPEGMIRSLYSSPDPRQCGWKCDFKDAHLRMRTGVKPPRALTEAGFRVDRTRH